LCYKDVKLHTIRKGTEGAVPSAYIPQWEPSNVPGDEGHQLDIQEGKGMVSHRERKRFADGWGICEEGRAGSEMVPPFLFIAQLERTHGIRTLVEKPQVFT
jgi:hypothetical protein